jgi:hypothetical protein
MITKYWLLKLSEDHPQLVELLHEVKAVLHPDGGVEKIK